MTKLELAKAIVTTIVGVSTSWTVQEVIVNNVDPESTLNKVEAKVGSVVIGAVVAEQTRSWTDRQIDAIADWWKSLSEIPTESE